MERMKLTAGVLALVALFGLAGCNQRPGTNAGNQTMERGGGGAGGAATAPSGGSSSGGTSQNAPSDNTGGAAGGSSGR